MGLNSREFRFSDARGAAGGGNEGAVGDSPVVPGEYGLIALGPSSTQSGGVGEPAFDLIDVDDEVGLGRARLQWLLQTHGVLAFQNPF